MVTASDRQSDLTTTIHLTALRSVQDPVAQLLERADTETKTVIGALSEGVAMLVALIGPAKGSRYLLDLGETTIGRSPDSSISLDDVTVSRRHATIKRSGDAYVLIDSGSLNGTYLNGAVTSSAQLRHGDEIQIGKFRLHFFLGGKR